METHTQKNTLKALFPKLFMTGILVYTVMINLNSQTLMTRIRFGGFWNHDIVIVQAARHLTIASVIFST